MGEGKDRGKQESGKDASGRPGSKHPDNASWQPESGTPVPDEKQAPAQRERTPAGENI